MDCHKGHKIIWFLLEMLRNRTEFINRSDDIDNWMSFITRHENIYVRSRPWIQHIQFCKEPKFIDRPYMVVNPDAIDADPNCGLRCLLDRMMWDLYAQAMESRRFESRISFFYHSARPEYCCRLFAVLHSPKTLNDIHSHRRRHFIELAGSQYPKELVSLRRCRMLSHI